MFVIDLEYVVPLEQVDALLDAHKAHLKAGHASGHFLLWGRKQPRTGGVILASGDRAEVESLANLDPFVTEGAARVTVTEIAPAFAAEGLESLLA
ncbi:YciI family protein [Aurantiacibacter sp. D1-12]|uniref:YciI family protein n=1 Tax=Aurantiacibacter sp. D1-12 TaxID=2993658 RepID=UPI00237C92A3|nr:YciI family protein [Aurantiacibacter sp. D1-12]MDE1467703.1 YciI family protein [Aurantiacibacter sp. D1-12]